MPSICPRKINLRALLSAAISLLDDAVVILLIIWLMSRFGYTTPWWLIGVLALIFLAWSAVGYRALLRNPTLGFENMVGKSGIVVEPLRRTGSVRIGHEIWQARADRTIEPGVEVRVVGQSGLNLTVAVRE